MLQKQRHELPLRGEGGHSSELEKMYYSQLSKTQVNVKLHSLSLNQKSLSSLAKQNSILGTTFRCGNYSSSTGLTTSCLGSHRGATLSGPRNSHILSLTEVGCKAQLRARQYGDYWHKLMWAKKSSTTL